MKKKLNNQPNTSAKCSESGFTLLELIIALTILVFIVVLAFNSIQLGIRAWETGGTRLDFFYRMKYLIDLMEKEFSSIRPYYYLEDEKKKYKTLAFQGLEDSISFISALESNDPAVSAAGIREVTFHLEENDTNEGNKLIMTEGIIKNNQPSTDTETEPLRSIVISEDVSDLNFRYYRLKSEDDKKKDEKKDEKQENDKQEDNGEWVDNYIFSEEGPDNVVLPRAIEVTMVIKTERKGIRKQTEKFYLPPFIVLLNAGTQLKFIKKEVFTE